jgi:hypothetical protein
LKAFPNSIDVCPIVSSASIGLYHTPSSIPYIHFLQDLLVQERAVEEEISFLEETSMAWCTAVAPTKVLEGATTTRSSSSSGVIATAATVFGSWLQMRAGDLRRRLVDKTGIPQRILALGKEYKAEDTDEESDEDNY